MVTGTFNFNPEHQDATECSKESKLNPAFVLGTVCSINEGGEVAGTYFYSRTQPVFSLRTTRADIFLCKNIPAMIDTLQSQLNVELGKALQLYAQRGRNGISFDNFSLLIQANKSRNQLQNHNNLSHSGLSVEGAAKDGVDLSIA